MPSEQKRVKVEVDPLSLDETGLLIRVTGGTVGLSIEGMYRLGAKSFLALEEGGLIIFVRERRFLPPVLLGLVANLLRRGQEVELNFLAELEIKSIFPWRWSNAQPEEYGDT